MKSDNNSSMDISMTTKRLETLVDGIFAIAMTLLVLGLEVPQIPYPATNTQIIDALITMSPQFFNYILSFVFLGVFWRINHTQFHMIKKTDRSLLVINIFWLLLVALVPFSTGLIGDYGYLTVPMAFFHLNIFLIGLLYNFNWYYAVNHNFIDEKVDRNIIESQKKLNLFFPVCALISVGIAFIVPEYSFFGYFGLFFMRRIRF